MNILQYYTISNYYTNEYIEKKSKFIGHIINVSDENKAIEFIKKTKKYYFDASHNVFAYYIKNNSVFKCSDDGEPRGTAGMPILNLIKHNNLMDVCIVVTRYFGGTMLGVGGLVRAYSNCVKLLIKNCSIDVMTSCDIFNLICDYSVYGQVSNLISKYPSKIENLVFSHNITFMLIIDSANSNKLISSINEIYSNNVIIKFNQKKYYFLN